MKEYFDAERCKKCGGECCFALKGNDKNFEYFVEQLDKYFISNGIDKINPIRLDYSACRYLSKDGCVLPWSLRPSFCKEFRCQKWMDELEKENIYGNENISVSGEDLYPDCSGVYRKAGKNGKYSIYQRTDDAFMICYKVTFNKWEIIEFATACYWERYEENICGEFIPYNSGGNPIVKRIE